MGEMPEWYALLQAAKYLQTPPWVLLEQPFFWYEWALDALSAENMAERNARKQSSGR